MSGDFFDQIKMTFLKHFNFVTCPIEKVMGQKSGFIMIRVLSKNAWTDLNQIQYGKMFCPYLGTFVIMILITQNFWG